MSKNYDLFSLVVAMERWDRLPRPARVEVHGMMRKVVSELDAALAVIESVYPPALPSTPPPGKASQLRLVSSR